MTHLYTPGQVQELLGVSATALRIYTKTYKAQLSTEATGKRRKFTTSDLCWLAFVKARTDDGDKHEEILAERKKDDNGEPWPLWQQFQADWVPPEAPPASETPQTPPVGNSTALVPLAQVQTLQAFLMDAQRREEELRDEIRERDEALQQLQRELGRVEGELSAMKAQPPRPKGFWQRLFGGSE